MVSVEPELWVQGAANAVDFYRKAFGATVLHRVGTGDEIVVRLAVGEAVFWISQASPEMKRLSPKAIDGTTGRVLLIVDDPHTTLQQAVDAGAQELAAVEDAFGWRLGRIVDPFGHEWEIGRPLA